MSRNNLELYLCNPVLNKECRKEFCYMNGGECTATRSSDFAVREPMRTGKWVNGHCTFCGSEAIWEAGYPEEQIFTPRCPRCGAHMEREIIQEGQIIRADW